MLWPEGAPCHFPGTGIRLSHKTRQKQSGCSHSATWKHTTWPLSPGLHTGPSSTCHAQYERSRDPETVRAGKSPERELRGAQMLNGGRSSQCFIPIHSPEAQQPWNPAGPQLLQPCSPAAQQAHRPAPHSFQGLPVLNNRTTNARLLLIARSLLPGCLCGCS